MGEETEIKVAVTEEEVEEIRQQLEELGFTQKDPAKHEENLLFDSSHRQLTGQGSALRLRRYGDVSVLTYKGPRREDPHFKIREEVESEVADFEAVRSILERLGLTVSFQYAKIRERFSTSSPELEVCIDQTPFGWFIEIEGTRDSIDQLREAFGWSNKRVLNENYVDLYRKHLEK